MSLIKVIRSPNTASDASADCYIEKATAGQPALESTQPKPLQTRLKVCDGASDAWIDKSTICTPGTKEKATAGQQTPNLSWQMSLQGRLKGSDNVYTL